MSGALSDKSWGIKNTSDNGIDIIAKPRYGAYAAKGGWYGYEVKTSVNGKDLALSEYQAKGANSFMQKRINDLANETGRYTPNRVDAADVAMAKVIKASQGKLDYQGDVVSITNFGKPTVTARITEWAPTSRQTQSGNSANTNEPKPATKPRTRK